MAGMVGFMPLLDRRVTMRTRSGTTAKVVPKPATRPTISAYCELATLQSLLGARARGRLHRVQRHRGLDQRLERVRVHRLSLVDIDRAADVSVQARIEQLARVLQGRALGEGQLHLFVVGLAGADDAV